jgi:hypothetical protein
MLRTAVVAGCLAASIASAHEARPLESALVQLGPDRTQLLFEWSLPASPDSVRRRIRADADHNGRLSPAEYGHLAATLAGETARALSLRLDGALVEWRIVDAKVTPGRDGDGHAGGLEALVFLETRPVPPGEHQVTFALQPPGRSGRRVRVAFESRAGPIRSLVGGRPAEGPETVTLGPGETCVLIVGAPVKPAP